MLVSGQSPVHSHLDYDTSSWYAAMSQRAKNKLQIMQSKTIRLILELEPRTHTTTEHMTKPNMLKIPGRVKQLRLNTAHKSITTKPQHTYRKTLKKLRVGHGIPERANGILLYQMSRKQKETHYISMR